MSKLPSAALRAAATTKPRKGLDAPLRLHPTLLLSLGVLLDRLRQVAFAAYARCYAAPLFHDLLDAATPT